MFKTISYLSDFGILDIYIDFFYVGGEEENNLGQKLKPSAGTKSWPEGGWGGCVKGFGVVAKK